MIRFSSGQKSQRSRVSGAQATRRPALEKAALGSVLALLAADALPLHGAPLAVLAGACAAVHLARWTLWEPWKTGRTPLVWVLWSAGFGLYAVRSRPVPTRARLDGRPG